MKTRRTLLTTAALAMPAIALGQTRRTIRLIVPFPPGGATDSAARILAERLAPVLEQSVVVENRSGGGGLIGADAVAKATPDGTTIGLIGAATLCAAPFIQASMPFDAARDFRAVTQITDSAVLLAVNTEVARQRGWTDMAAMVAWARANPGGIRVAHAGIGTVTHLALAALNTAAGVDITGVPYRGGAQAATDLIAGTIEGSADLPTALLPPIETGRARPMGVSSARRLALLPDVPAWAETAGLESVDIRSWNAILLPAATPEAEVQRLHAAIARVGRTPEFAQALRPLGYDAVVSDSPAAIAAMIARETPVWRRLVEISGARGQ